MLDVTEDSHRIDQEVAVVTRAVSTVMGSAVVLPAIELSGYRGYPLVEWGEGLRERMRSGIGPVLDRATLALWESWPEGMNVAAPPPALQIVGFASTAPWPRALRACRELRGFGRAFVVTASQPSMIRLAEADVGGVYVIDVSGGGTRVLVTGRAGGGGSPRCGAVRYWEEWVFAHGMRTRVIKFPPSMALP